jgi:hypothetical protein
MIVRHLSAALHAAGMPLNHVLVLAASVTPTTAVGFGSPFLFSNSAGAQVPAASAGSGLGSVPLSQSGLPGASTALGFIGGLRWFVLAAALAGLLISAIVWGISAHSNNSRGAGGGRTGVLVALFVALLAGAGPYLVNFFFGAGGAVS